MIELVGEERQFKIDILQQMIEEAGIKHKNVYVIAVSGVYRSGKSFFLNLLYTYLEYLSQVTTV